MRNDALSTQFVCLTMTKQITLDLTDCWLRLFWYFNLFHYSKLARLSLQWDLSWSPNPNSKQKAELKRRQHLGKLKRRIHNNKTNTTLHTHTNREHTHTEEEEQTHRKSNTRTLSKGHSHRGGSVNDETKSKSKTKFKMSPHRLQQQMGRRAKWGERGSRLSIAISKERQSKRADFLGALRL